MKRARTFALAALLGLSALAWSGRSDAVIVERVVAVVGDRPILLSELRHRGRPFLYRIAATTQSPAQAAAQETEMFRELLQRMIDDRLEEQAADKSRLTVTPEEVDGAIRNVAAQAKIPVAELVAEVRRQGLSEQDYRDEIRRQLLEGKLVQLRVRGRVRVTEQDARAAYDRRVRELSEQSMVDVRMLALRLLQGSTKQDLEAREVFAESLVTRARGGEEFCKLVELYSDDTQTKTTCGSRGAVAMAQLPPPLADVVKTLKPGEISPPIRFADEAIVIVQVGKQGVPRFEDVKEEMWERAFGEAMERQRKLWLQELRRGVYIDVRL